jgi:hypothetical protein
MFTASIGASIAGKYSSGMSLEEIAPMTSRQTKTMLVVTGFLMAEVVRLMGYGFRSASE